MIISVLVSLDEIIIYHSCLARWAFLFSYNNYMPWIFSTKYSQGHSIMSGECRPIEPEPKIFSRVLCRGPMASGVFARSGAVANNDRVKVSRWDPRASLGLGNRCPYRADVARSGGTKFWCETLFPKWVINRLLT